MLDDIEEKVETGDQRAADLDQEANGPSHVHVLLAPWLDAYENHARHKPKRDGEGLKRTQEDEP